MITSGSNFWEAVQTGTAITTNNTLTILLSEVVNDGDVCVYRAVVNARKSDGTQRATYIRTAAVYREGTVAVGTVEADYTNESDTDYDVTFVASGNSIALQVTGKNGVTVEWHGKMGHLC
ncbi:MAG: hypothetical protein QXU32_01835 [Nitrososphaerales archaeon]